MIRVLSSINHILAVGMAVFVLLASYSPVFGKDEASVHDMAVINSEEDLLLSGLVLLAARRVGPGSGRRARVKLLFPDENDLRAALEDQSRIARRVVTGERVGREVPRLVERHRSVHLHDETASRMGPVARQDQ